MGIIGLPDGNGEQNIACSLAERAVLHALSALDGHAAEVEADIKR